MNIIEYPIKNNRKWQMNQPMEVKGLILHSVGCACDDPYRFADSENNASANACVHAILGADGTVVHTLGWDRKGWHSGEPKGNANYIGVEMVEPSFIKYTGGATWTGDLDKTKEFCLKTYAVAVELFAYLCKMFNLNPGTDILSHGEITKLGWGSTHVDPHHIWDKIGLTMDGFRKDVEKAMNGSADDKVASMYTELLGRVPDEKGLATWLEYYNKNGFEKTHDGIANSTEGKTYYTKQLYTMLLGRSADASGLKTWTSKKTREEIYHGIVNSVEYKRKKG